MQRCWPLVGREQEKQLLDECLAGLLSGKGGTVLISGEAGVGKSRFVQEVLDGAGTEVLTGRSVEGGTPPYGPLARALRHREGQPNGMGNAAPAWNPLLPGDDARSGRAEASFDREALADSVLHMLRGDEPVVLFLDDLQWADSATLELLTVMADRLSTERILVIGVYRSDELPRGHGVRRLRDHLRRLHLLREVRLEALDAESTADLAAAILGASPDGELARVLFDQTHGLPFFVEELCFALQEGERLVESEGRYSLGEEAPLPTPESVRDALQFRLDGLSDSARGLLELAAVAGTESEVELLGELNAGELCLDELFQRGLLMESGRRRVAFRHALTRRAVYDLLAWSKRRELHRRVAEVLTARGAPPERTAEHWMEAGAEERAREAFLEAAERSCRVHAYRDAAYFGDQALRRWTPGVAEAQRIKVLERFAACAQTNGQLADAQRAWQEMLESPAVREEARAQAPIYRALAGLHELQANWTQADEAHTRARELYESAGEPAEAAEELLVLANRCVGTMQYHRGLGLVTEARALAEGSGSAGLRARAMALEAFIHATLQDLESAKKLANEALALALAHNETEAASEVYRLLAGVFAYASDYSGSVEAYDTALRYFRRNDDNDQRRLCLGCMSYVLLRAGEWKNAVDLAREILRDDDAPAFSRAGAHATLGLIRSLRGETKSALRTLEKCEALARQNNFLVFFTFTPWAMAVARECEGNEEEALRHYHQFLEFVPETEDRLDQLQGLLLASTFFSLRRMEQEANQCAKLAGEVAACAGNPEALGALAFILGEVALLHEKPKEAARQFEQGLKQFQQLEIPFETARTELRLAVALRALDRDEEAFQHLERADVLARKLGTRPLGAVIHHHLTELKPGNGPGKADRNHHGERLTRRQKEVAELLADGLTNKEIAAKLYLSTRTVDMHVANVLDRLDCRTRTEAVRKVQELGLLRV